MGGADAALASWPYSLSQYHPHYEFRTWLSTSLKPHFIGNLGHFIACVHAEVVHPCVNKTHEGAILRGLFVDKQKPHSCSELLDEPCKYHDSIRPSRIGTSRCTYFQGACIVHGDGKFTSSRIDELQIRRYRECRPRIRRVHVHEYKSLSYTLSVDLHRQDLDIPYK